MQTTVYNKVSYTVNNIVDHPLFDHAVDALTAQYRDPAIKEYADELKAAIAFWDARTDAAWLAGNVARANVCNARARELEAHLTEVFIWWRGLLCPANSDVFNFLADHQYAMVAAEETVQVAA